MKQEGFVAFFLEAMLKEVFKSKRKMARELGLQRRTIQNRFKRLDSAKGASLIFEYSICYCYEHGISVDDIFSRYSKREMEDRITDS